MRTPGSGFPDRCPYEEADPIDYEWDGRGRACVSVEDDGGNDLRWACLARASTTDLLIPTVSVTGDGHVLNENDAEIILKAITNRVPLIINIALRKRPSSLRSDVK